MSPGQLARLNWLCLTHFICCPLSTAGSIDLALGSLCLGCPPYPSVDTARECSGLYHFTTLALEPDASESPASVLMLVKGAEDRGLCASPVGGFLLAYPWEGTGSHRLFEMPCHILVRKMSRKGRTGRLPLFLLDVSHCFRRPSG